MDEFQKAILAECAARLGEHFEAALILVCTKTGTDGGTAMEVKTRGNYYAARGMAQEFLDNERAAEQATQIKSALGGEI